MSLGFDDAVTNAFTIIGFPLSGLNAPAVNREAEEDWGGAVKHSFLHRRPEHNGDDQKLNRQATASWLNFRPFEHASRARRTFVCNIADQGVSGAARCSCCGAAF
jgi:hypothetical protein